MNTNPSPVTAKLAELTALNAKTTALNAEIETARTSALQTVATELGYASNDEFLTAFLAANNIKIRGRKVTNTKTKATKSKGNKPRKARVIIDEAKGEKIIAFFKNGGSTVDAVPKFNISLATAQNWKDKAGMVEHRK